jgi:chromosome segregation ATPase
MASVGSTSGGKSVEDRLDELQQSIDLLKTKSEEHEGRLHSNNAEDLQKWKKFNKDLQNIKEDLKDSKGEVTYFEEVVYTHFKDLANTSGNYGNRIAALEAAVQKILEKLNIS